MRLNSWVSGLVLVAMTTGCNMDGGGPLASVTQAATVRTVIPVIDTSMQQRLQAIYQAGLAAGNREGVFSKVGDQMTSSEAFLGDVGCSAETLGSYTSIETTIDYFRNTAFPSDRTSAWCGAANSFSIDSYAASGGWTTANVLATFTQAGCPSPYNTPLLCELHQSQPSAALIMLGTNDLQSINNVTTFQNNLTEIVTQTINAGVIPVLSTIPPRLDSSTYGARVAAYNNAITAVAGAQNVPLWDYWVAVEGSTMVNQGMSSNGVDPNIYHDDGANFTTAALDYGYNQRNFTAIQVLAHLQAVVYDNGPADGTSTDAGTTDTGSFDAGTDAVADVHDSGAVDVGKDVAADVHDATADVHDAAADVVANDVPVDVRTDVGSSGDAGSSRSIIPVINASMQSRLRTIYQAGLTAGNREGVFSKVGDSITATGSFLVDIGCSVETLGNYTSIETTIDYFRATSFPASRTSSWCGVANSFSIDSFAATSGWTTADVLATISQSGCPAPYNTPLLCEYHISHPSAALIMLGTNDLQAIDNLTTYQDNLTEIVTQTINAGVIPVLSTIPPRLDSSTYGALVPEYNNVVMQVASAQNIPLWDYWVALEAPSMVNQGVGSDGIHPNIYDGEDGANFTTAALDYGYNQRNLTAIQVLAHLQAVVYDDGTPDP